MRSLNFWILVHLAAALVPLFRAGGGGTPPAPDSFPGWPQQFAGRVLEELPLSDRERFFAHDFPGRIARFSDGERELVIRWVDRPTRKLHPAADCLRGAGYEVVPQPIAVDGAGSRWGCVMAGRSGRSSRVCERIVDAKLQGFTDVSSWFWHSVLQRSQGPWWAVTVAEPL